MGRKWDIDKNKFMVSTKTKVDGKKVTQWNEEPRPKAKQELSEEMFMNVFRQLRKINYTRKRIDESQLVLEQSQNTTGANKLQEQDRYDDNVERLVYKRKKSKKEWHDKETPSWNTYLRTINPHRRTNLYSTFFYKALWEFEEKEVTEMMSKTKKRIQDKGVWEHFGELGGV